MTSLAGPGVELHPTTPRERIEVVDVLRGFAILGILLANMEEFSTSGYRTDGGELLWKGVPDRIAAFAIAHGVRGKFIILFSFLFGLGVAMHMDRLAAAAAPWLTLVGRRLLVLLVIGLAHGLLIWWGDILAFYAFLGALLLLFRRCRPRTLLVWAIALYALSFLEPEVRMLTEPSRVADEQADAATAGRTTESFSARAEAARDAYGRGTLAQIMSQRAWDFWSKYRHAYNEIPRKLAFFLVGLAAGRLGIFRGASLSRLPVRRILVSALTVGLVSHVARAVLYLPGVPTWTRLLRLPVGAVANPAVSLFYATAIALLYQHARGRSVLTPLGAVGRTALSNYLLQSVVCTTIFYSYGLGLYGELGPAAGLALSLVIFALQVPASGLWLRRCRFGPVEWLWRSLTYGRRQSLLAPSAPS